MEDPKSKKIFLIIKVLKIFIVITFCKNIFLKKMEDPKMFPKYKSIK